MFNNISDKVSFLLLCESSSKPFQKHQRKTFQVTKIKTGRLHGDNKKKNNREERSLRHVATVAKILDDNKLKK